MNRIVINLIFTISFLFLFLLIVASFFDDVYEAFSPKYFPAHQVLPLSSCQKWTERVRDFKLEEGEYAEKVTVLMYHRVLEDEQIAEEHLDQHGLLKKTIIRKSEFEKQIKALKEANYTVLNAKEFYLFMRNQLQVPKKSILLTFDDGYKDNFTVVYPILNEYNYTALNFLITSTITKEEKAFDATKHQYLSVKEIQKSCEVFEFQSHTYNYHRQTKEGESYLVTKSEEEIKKDLSISLVHLGGRKRSLAYPYGDYQEETIQILKELGIEMAFTTEYQDAVPGMNLYEIPRKEIFPEDTVADFRMKINER